MKRTMIILACGMALASCGVGKNSPMEYEWHYLEVDSRYDNGTNDAALKAIAQYEDELGELLEIIGYSADVYASYRPESPLSNFAADVIRYTAEKKLDKTVDVALTNFGGIRTELPKGAIRQYELFSIFPFNNYLVVGDIKGSSLREIFERMAQSRRVEALSGVELIVDGGKITKCNVGGKPLDDNKTYCMATINFLLTGGDGLRVGKYLDNLVELKDVMIRDAMVEYVKEQTAQNKEIVLSKDGRVVINK